MRFLFAESGVRRVNLASVKQRSRRIAPVGVYKFFNLINVWFKWRIHIASETNIDDLIVTPLFAARSTRNDDVLDERIVAGPMTGASFRRKIHRCEILYNDGWGRGGTALSPTRVLVPSHLAPFARRLFVRIYQLDEAARGTPRKAGSKKLQEPKVIPRSFECRASWFIGLITARKEGGLQATATPQRRVLQDGINCSN